MNACVAVIGIVMMILSLLMLVFMKKPAFISLLFVIVLSLMLILIPMINTLAFLFESQGIVISFGLGRGVGSAFYAVFSLLLGYLVKLFDPRLLPLVSIIALMGLIFLVSSFSNQSDVQQVKEERPKDVGAFIKAHVKFFVLIIGLSLVMTNHLLINNFMINVVNHVGGDSASMGKAVALATFLEIFAMNAFEKIKHRISVSKLLIFSLIMFSVKHILTFLAVNMVMIYLAQVLQMFAHAIFLPAGVYYVEKDLPKEDRSLGQSLMALTAMIGGVIASIGGGFLIDRLGISMALGAGMIVSLIGAVIAISCVDHKI
jgi:PPP family 3-phenylpropionic acid transporter